MPTTQGVENPADAALDAARLAQANINPATGLAIAYLHHFHQAIMLLQMLAERPDYRDDLLAWRPLSYREYLTASHFRDRQVALIAYQAADAGVRDRLEELAATMSAILRATCLVLRADLPPTAAQMLTELAVDWLKLLVAQAGRLIDGQAGGDAPASACPPAAVDVPMTR